MPFRILMVLFFVVVSDVKGQTYPFIMQADAGILLGYGVHPVPGLQVFNGIRLDRQKAEAGLTVGVDVYSQFNILPVSATLKWTPLLQKELRPYLAFNMGYGLAWLNNGSAEEDYRGGFVFNPSLGLRIKTKAKAKMNFAIGYKQQRAGIVYRSFDNLGRTVSETSEKYKFGRVSLNFGVGF